MSLSAQMNLMQNHVVSGLVVVLTDKEEDDAKRQRNKVVQVFLYVYHCLFNF